MSQVKILFFITTLLISNLGFSSGRRAVFSNAACCALRRQKSSAPERFFVSAAIQRQRKKTLIPPAVATGAMTSTSTVLKSEFFRPEIKLPLALKEAVSQRNFELVKSLVEKNGLGPEAKKLCDLAKREGYAEIEVFLRRQARVEWFQKYLEKGGSQGEWAGRQCEV